ncbi:MAG: prepilin peptidase [Lentisphaeria bacterium]|nr:prepilin peptidase [Lentisphaeria bacterium]
MQMFQPEAVELLLPFYTIAVFLFGTVVGSFLNVVVWRLPRGESLSHPPSHCPKCGHAIRAWENIPILGWIFLRGRCSQCSQPISMRYPIVEAANGMLFLLMWYAIMHRGLPASSVFGYCVFAAALFAIAQIDWEHYLIPDKITFPCMAIAGALALAFPETHISTAMLKGTEPQPLLLGGLLDLLDTVWPTVRDHWRVVAGLDALLGITFGYAVLWLIMESAGRLWGRSRCILATSAKGVFTAKGLKIGNEFTEIWEDVFIRRGDRLVVHAKDIEIIRDKNQGKTVFPEAVVSFDPNGVRVQNNRWDWAELKTVHAEVAEWVAPREVMGQGDLKLLAMVGAFLGADATIYIMLLAAFFGCFIGIGIMLTRAPENRHAPIPFGPFVALAAILWIVYGQALFTWYGRFLTRLLVR